MRISDWSSDVCSSDLPIRGSRRSTASIITRIRWATASCCGAPTISPTLRKRKSASCGRRPPRDRTHTDRKSVVEGKSVSVRVDLGGRRIIKKTTTKKRNTLTLLKIHQEYRIRQYH